MKVKIWLKQIAAIRRARDIEKRRQLKSKWNHFLEKLVSLATPPNKLYLSGPILSRIQTANRMTHLRLSSISGSVNLVEFAGYHLVGQSIFVFFSHVKEAERERERKAINCMQHAVITYRQLHVNAKGQMYLRFSSTCLCHMESEGMQREDPRATSSSTRRRRRRRMHLAVGKLEIN